MLESASGAGEDALPAVPAMRREASMGICPCAIVLSPTQRTCFLETGPAAAVTFRVHSASASMLPRRLRTETRMGYSPASPAAGVYSQYRG